MIQTMTTANGAKATEPIAADSPLSTSPAGMEVPERPVLAPNVELVGELKEAGFKDRQWLLQRDGQFIQVTELLYRVLEQANGERTLEEIAAGVTETTEWLVDADQVRLIVRTVLIPRRLIAPAEGVVVPVKSRARSPLAVNMRMRFLGPRILDPITYVLQWLYAPPVLVPVLITVVLAHWWVYFVHGIGGSVRATLFTPGALPLVFLLMIAAAFFHEFGHAAALRYGGGRVRGIGAGIYIVYPVFYTDVTDSYRLGRWARVRTDLGGFYFHLIFVLGAVAFYWVSGHVFLLVLVPLINFAIFRECLPFIRFDGYWVLADLTGIPDFFSLMRPYVLSLLPAGRLKGMKLPPLKRRVRRFFAAYILAAVPVLALLFVLMVIGVPYLITTTWEAFFFQTDLFAGTWRTGDYLTMVVSAFQILFLVLPVVGTAYILYRVLSSLFARVWKWSRSGLKRRVVGGLVNASVIAMLAFLWVPPLKAYISPAVPEGVQNFTVTERRHIQMPVAYAQTPPVGGAHAPVWQNCGFYDVPIANENGVHSLEHGAVWITYRPDLAQDQVKMLHPLTLGRPRVLVSPYPDLPAPVVASAWGHQLRLESVDDPRLEQFVRAFENGRQAPEQGGPCSGGVGNPQ